MASVKAEVEIKQGVPVDAQRMIFEGDELLNEQTLNMCNVFRYSQIHLRIVGGGTEPDCGMRSANRAEVRPRRDVSGFFECRLRRHVAAAKRVMHTHKQAPTLAIAQLLPSASTIPPISVINQKLTFK